MGVRKTEIDRWKGKRSADFVALNPGLDAAVPLAGAPCAAPKAKTGQPAPKSPLAVKFEEAWARLGGPTLMPEFRFHPKRKWRFDFAIPELKIAIELEGLIYGKGRHQTLKGYSEDCVKYFSATINGWVVFRLPRILLRDEEIKEIIRYITSNGTKTF